MAPLSMLGRHSHHHHFVRQVPRAAIRGPFSGGEQARRPGADDDDAAPRFLGLRVKRPMAATR
eukprot:scaffold96168_cov41-Phaeocystis_antarctica.AAC.1